MHVMLENETNKTNETVDITLYSEDEKLNLVWAKAFDAWISRFTSQGTLRAYKDS